MSAFRVGVPASRSVITLGFPGARTHPAYAVTRFFSRQPSAVHIWLIFVGCQALTSFG
jgi:hypothetical protein